ncbi:solute carrier family 25 member 45-like [Cylas formicarius]|uniref:solute carrier family 25 member 45-like n=1 Tax=Cylas formicarius TaxID=197179 RepID=UPI002958BE53|nr:solute carrier family 25 member 45-like [Cylas formicarius]
MKDVFIIDFIAGWVGGLVSLAFTYPLDTIKVRQQNFSASLYIAIRETYRHEGILAFYKGLLSPMIAYGPSNSIFFGLHGICLRCLQHRSIYPYMVDNNMNEFYLKQFYAGSFAGFFQAAVMCPVELVKTVLQTTTDGASPWVHNSYTIQYSGPVEAFRGIINQDGFKGLYRGFIPMLIRDVPTSGIYFVVYEALLPENRTVYSYLWAGGWAGILSTSTVLPADVVKTRIQADNPIYPSYHGSTDCIKKLYNEFGARIFWKGLPIITLRAFPSHAIMFVGYEITIYLLQSV